MGGGTCTYGLPKDFWEPFRKNLKPKKERKERDFGQENLDKWLEENKGKKIFNREEAEKKAKAYHRKRQNKQK